MKDIDEAIKPCEDCISREDTLNKINALIAEYIPLMPIGWTLPLNIAKTINELPSVTPTRPKGKWLHPFDVKEWLESFNTESAPQCFNKIQDLKREVEKECI